MNHARVLLVKKHNQIRLNSRFGVHEEGTNVTKWINLSDWFELRSRTTALCWHLRLLLLARAYVYRRKDLHEDADARFIRRFILSITHKPYWQSRGVFVGHIHLDKNTFSILFHKGVIYNFLLIILFDGDCVHIYVNNLIQIHQQ
jgi:hypothetical protein